MMNKSLKAFTIVEMLVVIVLSAIVSALLYQAVLSVSALYQNFEKRQREVQAITFWYTMLSKDIANADKVEAMDNKLVTVKGGKTVLFKLTSTALYREVGSSKDSLSISNGEFLVVERDSSVSINLVRTAFQYGGKPVLWQFYKKHSAEEELSNLGIQ